MIRKIFEKAAWRLLALAVAFALWLTFVGSPEFVTSVSAPVEYQNMPADLEPVSELPQRVYLEVKGPPARLHGFGPSEASVILNLDGIHRAGEQTMTINRKSVDLPAGVSLVRAVPAQIRLNFERLVTADVPVRARIGAPPAAGYHIAAVQVTPRLVKIAGVQSRVRRITVVETDPVDLAGAIGKSEFQVSTFSGDPQVRLVSPPSVHVSITLAKDTTGGAPTNGKTAVRH